MIGPKYFTLDSLLLWLQECSSDEFFDFLSESPVFFEMVSRIHFLNNADLME